MSMPPIIYKAFNVNARVISLKWVSAAKFDENLEGRLLRLKQMEDRLKAYKPRVMRMIGFAQLSVAQDSGAGGHIPQVHKDYNAICMLGAKKLDYLLYFWRNKQHLERIESRYGRDLQMDLAPYQTQNALLAHIGGHIRDTLFMLDRLERFISPKDLKNLQKQTPFSRSDIAYNLAEAGVWGEFMTVNINYESNEKHVFNGLTGRKERHGNVITFNPSGR